MDETRSERLKDLFFAAIERPHEEQTPFVLEACGDDVALREQLEAMLRAHSHTTNFLEKPIGPGRRALTETAAPPAIDALPHPSRVGPYRILRFLGGGGMGAVYLAERAEGGFEQRVALKLVRSGSRSERILLRFEQERRALAALVHPNIAHFLGGGTTDEGTPYLVMEYVAGDPIHDYCERRCLPIRDRLDLFLHVCSAVQYSHRNLIVHRDLKPTNILVSEDGVPKLLDFGIAKLLDTDASGSTPVVTSTGEKFFTLHYASPEQIRGDTITTSSDLYSLGVVLYELLTGRLPYSFSTDAPLEMARVICEKEPTRPSSAVCRAADEPVNSNRPSVSVAEDRSFSRGSKPERLRRELAGDLDVILLKSLRKEPEQRYPSVEALADDIRRHGNGVPINARRPTLRYRTSRFLRRHRAGVAATLLILLTSVGATIATAREAHRARQESAAARRVREFVTDDLRELLDPRMSTNREVARHILASGRARELARDIRDQPGALAEFASALADVSRRYHLHDLEAQWRERALAALERRGVSERDRANATRDLGVATLRTSTGAANAVRWLRDALEQQRALPLADARWIGETVAYLAEACWRLGDVEQALALCQESVRVLSESIAPTNASIGRVTVQWASYLQSLGRLEESERRLRELTLDPRGRDPVDLARIEGRLARVVCASRGYVEAEILARRSLGRLERELPFDHPEVAARTDDLAFVLAHSPARERVPSEPLQRWVQLADRGLEIRRRIFGPDSLEVASSQLTLCRMIPHAAAVHAEGALRTYRGWFPSGHPALVDPLLRSAACADRANLGHEAYAGALACVEEALSILEHYPAPGTSSLAGNHRGAIFMRMGRTDETSAALVASTMAIRRRHGPNDRRHVMALKRVRRFYDQRAAPAEVEEYQRSLLRWEYRWYGDRVSRDDDGFPETVASLDYDDDLLEKVLHVAPGSLPAERARIWIFGRPYNFAGRRFTADLDYRLRVNDVEKQTVEFNLAELFGDLTGPPQWVPLEFPATWLAVGDNVFQIFERRYADGEPAWEYNNLTVGVDTTTDANRSWWYGNGHYCCEEAESAADKGLRWSPELRIHREHGPDACRGELMIFLELEGP